MLPACGPGYIMAFQVRPISFGPIHAEVPRECAQALPFCRIDYDEIFTHNAPCAVNKAPFRQQPEFMGEF